MAPLKPRPPNLARETITRRQAVPSSWARFANPARCSRPLKSPEVPGKTRHRSRPILECEHGCCDWVAGRAVFSEPVSPRFPSALLVDEHNSTVRGLSGLSQDLLIF